MSLSGSVRRSRKFTLKTVERLEAGERASALAIELNLNRTVINHWRDRFRANGAEALTSDHGFPRPPEVLAAESLPASRAGVDGLVQAQAQLAELKRKVGQQQLDLDSQERLAAQRGFTPAERRAWRGSVLPTSRR